MATKKRKARKLIPQNDSATIQCQPANPRGPVLADIAKAVIVLLDRDGRVLGGNTFPLGSRPLTLCAGDTLDLTFHLNFDLFKVQ